MSHLDCVDLLLGIPYQEQCHVVYHAHYHQYHLTQNGCTDVLTSSSLKAPPLLEGQDVIHQVILNKALSLCLVCPLKPDQAPQPLPSDMSSLLIEFEDVFSPPEGLPPPYAIEHSIDLILGASLPNSPSYHLAPREAAKIERQL